MLRPAPQNMFLSMYNTTDRTSAAATMWSFFSCRHSRMPIGSVEAAWQLQFYTPGLTASPPPPAGKGIGSNDMCCTSGVHAPS